jgi:type IV secretion system protein VirB6
VGKKLRLLYLASLFLALNIAIFYSSITRAADNSSNDSYIYEDQESKELTSYLKAVMTVNCDNVNSNQNDDPDNPTHTCGEANTMNSFVAKIVSPGIYSSALSRLHVRYDKNDLNNDNDPEARKYVKALYKQCDDDNKADYNNPTISFAMCRSATLKLLLIKDGLKNLVNGAKDARVVLPKAYQYEKLYENAPVGKSGIFVDLSIPIPWKIKKVEDKICVSVLGLTGYIPAGCKYIKEPKPESKYKIQCQNNESCYKRSYENSMTPLPISGPIIECIQDALGKLMRNRQEVCTYNGDTGKKSITVQGTSTFYNFQKNMHSFVSILLTLYVVFFGAKIALSGEIPSKGEFIGFAIKLILVVYFSVGLSTGFVFQRNAETQADGITQLIFPLLTDISTSLANWISNSNPSGLCDFSNYSYPKDLSHLRLWDSIDCTLSYYLGINLIQTVFASSELSSALNASSVPPYLLLLLPAIWSGNLQIIGLILTFPALIISLGAFVVNATAVALIVITILCILAPIFVPCALFNRTASYFDAWKQLLISTSLQPIVATAFMMLAFSLYGQGFYGACKYSYTDFAFVQNGLNESVVNLSKMPSSKISGKITKKARYFYINNDWTVYSPEDAQSCQTSLGYLFNKFDDKSKIPGKAIDKDSESVSQLAAKKEGLFITAPELDSNQSTSFFMRFLIPILLLFVIKNLAEQLTELMSDLTGGISMRGTTMQANALGKALEKKLSQKQKGKDSRKNDDDKESKDRASIGDGAGEAAAQGEASANTEEASAPRDNTANNNANKSEGGAMSAQDRVAVGQANQASNAQASSDQAAVSQAIIEEPPSEQKNDPAQKQEQGKEPPIAPSVNNIDKKEE